MFASSETSILVIDWRVSLLTPIEGWTIVTTGGLHPMNGVDETLQLPRRPRRVLLS